MSTTNKYDKQIYNKTKKRVLQKKEHSKQRDITKECNKPRSTKNKIIHQTKKHNR